MFPIKLLYTIIKNPIIGLEGIGYGLDIHKNTIPKVYQVYLATDTKKVYYCEVEGIWIEYTDEDTIQQQKVFSYEGDAIVGEEIINGLYFKSNIKITKITLFSRRAPTGLDLKVDLLSNGIEQNKVSKLSNGSRFEETDIVGHIYTTIDRFGLKIIQIGSILPGTSLLIVIHYEEVI